MPDTDDDCPPPRFLVRSLVAHPWDDPHQYLSADLALGGWEEASVCPVYNIVRSESDSETGGAKHFPPSNNDDDADED
jgi:hypothetical protein